jgi:tRNA G10  N-methylase Trm11
MNEHNGAHRLGPYELYLGDALEWLDARPDNSAHAIVTDPPYGLKEYTESEKRKLRAGRGGVWRIPPSFDGCKRRPIPRFTVLDQADHRALKTFFLDFARRAIVSAGGARIHSDQPAAFSPRLRALYGSGIRETWRDHPLGADSPWWRQAKECSC